MDFERKAHHPILVLHVCIGAKVILDAGSIIISKRNFSLITRAGFPSSSLVCTSSVVIRGYDSDWVERKNIHDRIAVTPPPLLPLHRNSKVKPQH